jgi:hypothetical protein
MLEALVRTTDGHPDKNGNILKRKGDIISVRKAGSVWGDFETKVHQLIELEDDELEAEVEKYGVINYPYKEYKEVEKNGRQVKEITKMSRIRFDISFT